MTLTDVQARAVEVGSAARWLGARETGVQGNTMVALQQKGLAEQREERKPYRRFVYRLTKAGVEEQARRKPLWQCTEDELIDRHVAGVIDLNEYVVERDRRARIERQKGPDFYAVAMRIAREPHATWEEFVCSTDPDAVVEVAAREAERTMVRATVVQWRSRGSRPTPAPMQIIKFGRIG